jgi:uncharacterized protein YecT (DUF1311 family)
MSDAAYPEIFAGGVVKSCRRKKEALTSKKCGLRQLEVSDMERNRLYTDVVRKLNDTNAGVDFYLVELTEAEGDQSQLRDLAVRIFIVHCEAVLTERRTPLPRPLLLKKCAALPAATELK